MTLLCGSHCRDLSFSLARLEPFERCLNPAVCRAAQGQLFDNGNDGGNDGGCLV